MADNGEPLVPSAGPKAIASLAKKSSDVTRQGAQKLKFVPTLPARRKKEEAKQEVSQSSVQPSERGNGRGHGRGRGAEGRGAAPRLPPVEMTASGPFAMGPALSGTSVLRSAPRSDFISVIPQGPAKALTLGVGSSNLAAPTSKRDKQRESPLGDLAQIPKECDAEVYSEPDEGVGIIDMENVHQLDWMAPETLQREWRARRKRKDKTEIEDPLLRSGLEDHGPSAENADLSNALDLGGSEEEEEFEDLMEDFTIQASMSEEQLYFFQFPEPFPTFVSASVSTTESPREMDTPNLGPSALKSKVSFAKGARPTTPAPGFTVVATQVGPEAPEAAPKVDGVIGRVEVYRSGMVKMRMGNGIVLNVSEATRPSFLQQAVHLDMENKKLHVLGEVKKRFVVSPDLDALLASVGLADSNATGFDDTNLLKMDTA